MDYAYQGRHPPPQLVAMVAQTNATIEDQPWNANSGANAHITNNLENFQADGAIVVGNGAGLLIKNTGFSTLHSSFNSTFHLTQVLLCPQAIANLLFIQRFCIDNDCYFILMADYFYVKDFQTHAVLLEGISENDLYPLWLRRTSLLDHHSFTAFLGIKTFSMGWHFRLGHSTYDIVSQIVKKFNLPLSLKNMNKDVICTSCQLGKSTRQPFTPSQRVSTQPFQLIHTNVWTSPVSYISGYKYYVVFIDDLSHYSWIYPLHAKFGVFDQFVKFKLMVENQFSLIIKQVQSDGGGEYNSLQFQSFFTKYGIIHRKSCPNTSQ